MAKVLFANIPAHGHINPTFPLVSALVKAGHSVDYLITEDFRRKVEYCGANLIPCYRPFNIDFSDFLNLIKNMRKYIKELNLKIKQIAPKYDVIFIGGMNPSIAELEKEIEAPIVHCSAVFFQSEGTIEHLFKKSWGIPSSICYIVLHPNARKSFSRLVLSPALGIEINDILDVFKAQSSTLNIAFTSRYFQPEDKDFDEKCLFIGPTPTISVLDNSFPMSRLGTTPKKIIYATLGTVYNNWIGFFKNVIEAFKNSEYVVVMSTGNKERLKEIGYIPDNFIVSDFVPQVYVLKHAALFITHGGMGSISDGIYYGVPMLLIPRGADQFFNAYRLQELQAGKVLKSEEVTPENLKHEAGLIIENKSFEVGVKRIWQSFINAGGPERALKEVEKILKR